MLFGFAVRDITPPLGLPMGGYGARTGVASGVRDPLQCRCAVFRNDSGAGGAILVLDLLTVSARWTEPVRRRIAASIGVAPEAVLVAATHTHAGPALFGVGTNESAATRRYEAGLEAIVVDTAMAAARSSEPANLAFGHTSVEGVGADRTDAGGSLQSNLDVLVARRADGRTAGAVASYGCHPTILPPSNLEYSRDLFGAAVDRAESLIGAPVMLFNGAAADVSTRFTRRGQDSGEVERLGGVLGEALRRGVVGAVALASDDLTATVRQIALEWRALPEAARAQLAVTEAAAALQKANEAGATVAERRLAQSRLEGAMAQNLIAASGGARSLLGSLPTTALVQRIRIAGCDLPAAPGEILAADGRAIGAAGARPSLLIGYANDYLGYLVTCAAEPGGYEALVSLVAPQSASAIVEWLANGDDA